MTYLPSRRAAFLGGVVPALLLVLAFAFSAPARADNENATSTDGANGANAGQVIATSTDGTGGLHDVGGTITTGNANATSTTENSVNLNDVSNVDSPGDTNSSTFNATSSNDALVNNFATSTASTGANVAEGGQGLATVVTGNAFAFANVINLINTNIFNSQGLLLFLNQIFSTGLDLRDFNLDYFFDGQAGNSPTVDANGQPQCTLLTCLNSSALNVLDTNVATVTNSVIVRANTGDNTATTSEDGGALVGTGDAYAAANVVNLVNTNIINSSYLMVSFNNFGDLDGNITLPNDDFFSKLFAHEGSAPEMNSSSYGVNNTNALDLTGTTTADADTGNNLATTTGEGSGIISTGDAYSKSNTFTDANNNYVGGTSAFFMFRVAGEWTGTIKGLPDHLRPLRMFDVTDHNGILSTSTLVLITNEDTDGENVPVGDPSGLQDPQGAAAANCQEPRPNHPEDQPVSNCFNSSSFLASSTNAAIVDNNIDVGASTGHNLAVTENGDAHIISGDAYAIANVVNLVNTNIVGRNWIFALFNVLGNWNGDITFGKSALMLAAKTADAPVAPGTDVQYDFTVTNRGDRDADDITLKADFDKNLLTFSDIDGTPTASGRQWHIPTVPRGQSRTFSYTAHVGSIPAGTSLTVPVAASVLSDGTDAAAQASFTLATLAVVSTPTGGGGGGGGGGKSSSKTPAKNNALTTTQLTSDPSITVVKTATVGTSTAPASVDYRVVVTNSKTAGTAYNGILTDRLIDPAGQQVYERSWDLSTIAPGDQITLTYSVEFAATSTPGTYTNTATVSGNLYNTKPMTPAVGASSVVISPTGSASIGAVLGAAVDCSLAVSMPLYRGAFSPEVAKLQRFLNTQGASLPGTNLFGPMTQAAVSAFQLKYAADILAPLGLTHPTGTVGGMTIKKIKALACADSVPATSASSQ